MNKRYFRFILFYLVLLPFSNFGQENNVAFKQIYTEQGLSQAYIISIAQDKQGFMWFGTNDGLNRYDGYNFKTYRNNPKETGTISHNIIFSLVADKKGSIWVATPNGLNKLDPQTNRFKTYKHSEKEKNALAHNFVNKVYEDSKGKIWVGTRLGLELFNPQTNKLTSFIEEAKEYFEISDIIEDQNKVLWLATNTGLYSFHPETKVFQKYKNNPSQVNSLGYNIVSKLLVDRNNNLWIGTRGGGLDVFDNKRINFSHFRNDKNNVNSLSHNTVLALTEDEKGNIWIGTDHGGVSIFNPKQNKFTQYQHDEIDKTSLSSNSIHAIYLDNKANLWLGTFNSGINLYNKQANQFSHFKHTSSPKSLSNNFVLAMLEDSRQNIWIGTDGGGLNLFNPKSNSLIHFINNPKDKNSICGNYVLSACEDSEGNLWVGTWGDGISILDAQKKVIKHIKINPNDSRGLISNNIWTLKKASDNKIWIGTHGGGITIYDPALKTYTSYARDVTNPESIKDNEISFLLEDQKKNMWVGTFNGGLSRFNPETKSFKHYLHTKGKNSLSNNTISFITETKDGKLVIATGAGLNIFDSEKEIFKVYTTKDGLPTNAITSALEDDLGNLWIGSTNGISQFDRRTQYFTNYTVAEGLQADIFKPAALKSKSGALYFGGINGFNIFNPKNIKTKNYTSPIYITGFQIFNKDVPIVSKSNPESPLKNDISVTQEITLPYDQSVLTLQFASLDYTYQKSLEYAYKLENFDRDWNLVKTNRTATYTNLDPGEYIFKVKTIDSNQNWSVNEGTVKLIITPPFWMTWWFKLLVLALILGIIYLVFKIRLRLIEDQKRQLEIEVEERTAVVINQKEALENQANQLQQKSENLNKLNLELQSQTEDLKKITDKLIIQKQQEAAARNEAELARKEAEKANQAKSLYLATMSHEIRTPLNGVLGMTSLLGETELDAEQRNYTEIIKSSGKSLLAVINDILDFSKIESGNMELDYQVFDLRETIEEVLDMFANKAASQNLDLLYQMEYNVPLQIYGDSMRLKQILINLIGNALKFTSSGEVFVGVKLIKQLENQELELQFDIRDTGIGIPADKLDKLFKAFMQVDSSTTRKYGGTGLGLAICKRLVELMQGEISAESIMGESTTFRFTMRTKASTQAYQTYVYLNTEELKGKKILVVDDNATNRTILENQLKHWNFIPVLAGSAKEALIELQSQTFDLVITDMSMPDIDGVTLSQSIKKQQGGLPLILLSSIGNELQHQYKDLFYSILTKPVKQQQLYKQVVSCLKLIQRTEKQKPEEKLLTTDFAKQFPLKILIAEDYPFNQLFAQKVLAKLGYQSDLAENGLLAVEAFEQKNYDVILMDVQMPEMDGLEATRIIRASKNKQPYIIATTANAMQEDMQNCLNAGMDSYIAKPIDLENLIQALKKAAITLQVNLETEDIPSV